jgi:tRNA (guanine-N7-)-methyltransferase
MGPQLRRIYDEHAAALGMPEGRWTALPGRTVLEIGSGSGDSLVAAAADFDLAIGVDVHLRGLAATMRSVRAAGVRNVRLVRGDAIEVLRDQVPPGSLAEVHVWFPDPWPKVRHHKRRLIRPEVVAQVAAALAPGGVLRLATDMAEYAAAMQDVLGRCSDLEPLGDGGLVPRPGWRPVTRYEAAGGSAGRPIVDLAYRVVRRDV